ncbi:hypothetical protein CT0861_00925 [Colletotrichum tofieldiae]|uniref:Uncharacterized protein n=1 Tax=Colletotrichum tofieldiae TaxID=708197 RepID=A0A166WR15_9PEZI|nr:hypothetical protein CT0861_00925 [Colletotrichum tofieldiae]
MCYVYRHRHICCDCNRIMSSKDGAGWCEKRTWVRPSPFEHAVAHCPEGTRLVHVDYKVMRCVACHFGPPSHEEDCRQQPRRPERQRRRRQGQYDEPPEGSENDEPSDEAPGLLLDFARYVSSVLGGLMPAL